MNRYCGCLLLIFCIVLGSVLAAEEVKVTAKKVWGDTDTNINYLEGDVRFVQGSTVITTEKAQVDTDRKTALFERKVRLIHPDVKIQSKNLEYDLKKEIGTFKNDVIMERIKTKATKGEAAKDPFTLLTDKLYFETETKNFIAQKGRIEHKDFTGEADLIEYNDQSQQLILKEKARLTRPEGEEIRGKLIIINVSEKSFKVIDSASMQFEVEGKVDVN